MINTTTEPTAPRYPILVCMTRLSRSTFLYAGTRKRAYQKADGGPYADAATSHGHPWMLLHRQGLLDLLYRRLPEKETRVLTNKKVVSIETQADGVRVRCDDGSTEEGSIVIGCDGVHSRVRQIMRDLSLRSSAKVRDSESPMVAQYQVLAGHLNRIPHLPPGRLWEVRDTRFSMQIFMLEDEGWFLVYRQLQKPATQSTRYTDEDAEAFANEIMDRPINDEGMKFRDLWEVRKWIRLLNVEEGLVQTWHHDRIVLVGDSVHKMAPNAGLGFNQGWQGVVVLTNLLRRLLLTDPHPDTKSLTKVFEAYKAGTQSMAADSSWLSKFYLRATSWHNTMYKIADCIGPYVGGDELLFRMLASPIVKGGNILDFVPESGHKAGRFKWKNQPVEKRDAGDSSTS